MAPSRLAPYVFYAMTQCDSPLQVLEPLLLRVMEAVHEGRDFPMLMSLHLSILSRLMLASHSLFAALCLSTATKLGSNHNDVAGKVGWLRVSLVK